MSVQMMRVVQELEAAIREELGDGGDDEVCTLTRDEIREIMICGVMRVARRDPDLSFLVRDGLGLGRRVERSRVRDKWSRI